jgi:uncharacterized protein (UPF0548 family)
MNLDERVARRHVPRREPALTRLTTALRWPAGIALTAWRYMWRTVPVDRWELSGSPSQDAPPPLPAGFDLEDVQQADDGVGPLAHRIYRVEVHAPQLSPEELMRHLGADLDRVAPSEFATFRKLAGAQGRLAVGDELIVRMPGPWDGPVRVVDTSPTSFRLATLTGHLEAGQIEFRASAAHRSLTFVIESWARSGDRLSDLLYSHLRMAKEVQLHMWTSVLQRVIELSGGRRAGPIVVSTRRLDGARSDGGTGPHHQRARRRLAELARLPINFDPQDESQRTPENGWHFDDLTEALPHEASGPPMPQGSWQIARVLMDHYQVADPRSVRATYDPGAPLEGRNMLLQIRFALLRFSVGVRIGHVYDERREVDGRPACVFGWSYSTLRGHFEEGRMHYELWKWLDTGDVEFRLHAFSRAATSGPLLPRLGFRLLGRRQQLRFYRSCCRRMRRLTETQLETNRMTRSA